MESECNRICCRLRRNNYDSLTQKTDRKNIKILEISYTRSYIEATKAKVKRKGVIP